MLEMHGTEVDQEVYHFNSDSGYLCDVEQVNVFPDLHCPYPRLEHDLK